MTAVARLERLAPDRETIYRGGILLNLEIIALFVYLLAANVRITNPLILVYPLVWINVGLWALVATTPAPAPTRTRRIGLLVAAAYFAILAAAGGLIAPGHAVHGHAHGGGIRIAWEVPPGFGPALLYNGDLLQVALMPYKVVGYLALSYLIYATVLDAAGSALSGLVGVFSCVSCTWPVLGTVLTGVFGSASAVAAFATGQPYAASTLVFVSAVALLAWRPTL